jgi:hypothetical protein
MIGKNGKLEGGQELTTITQKDFNNGNLLSRIIDSVNGLAQSLSASAVGKITPPPPIDGIQVQGTQQGNTITCPSENLHWTLTHNGSITKNIQYISEYSTEPNFLSPTTHVFDHGCSRTGNLSLATFQNDGKTPNTYYLRSFAQYPGSDPAKPTVFGGLTGATKIVMTGTSANTLLSSTGSGTASTQRAQGLGTELTRPAPAPKRNVA